MKTIFDWGIYSFIGHFILLVLFANFTFVNTPKPEKKIEVEIRESAGKVAKSHSPVKPLIPRSRGPEKTKKPPKTEKENDNLEQNQDVDPVTYAEKLKSIVDPVYIRKIRPYLYNNIKFHAEILIFLDKYGNIINVKVNKSSGYPEIDRIAVNTFKEVGTLLPPPAIVAEKGLIWDFYN
jgi:hypothetical protein